MTTKPAPAPPGVEGHEGLIQAVIKRHHYHQPGVRGLLEIDDLINAGRVGLWRATQTYDATRGAWSTYASWWIRQAIAREIQNAGGLIRVPCHAQARRFREGRRIREAVRSLDAPLRGTDGNVTLADTLEAPAVEPVNDAADTAARLLDAAQLDPRERSIIAARFGARECTLEGIARPQGCTRERVRQIEHRALAKLRVAARRLRIDAGS